MRIAYGCTTVKGTVRCLPHYYDQEPAATSAPTRVRLALPDMTLDLTTDRGVFARDGIDPGTKLLLLEAPPLPASGDVLDLGCGYGAIAVPMARRSPGATVWAVDVNRRALALTALNAEAAGCANVRAVEPDGIPPELVFAAIWSNPPIRIGKDALHELLTTWLARLAAGGRAVFVVQKHLGADSLARWLEDNGYAVTRLKSRMAYRLLSVERS